MYISIDWINWIFNIILLFFVLLEISLLIIIILKVLNLLVILKYIWNIIFVFNIKFINNQFYKRIFPITLKYCSIHTVIRRRHRVLPVACVGPARAGAFAWRSWQWSENNSNNNSNVRRGRATTITGSGNGGHIENHSSISNVVGGVSDGGKCACECGSEQTIAHYALVFSRSSGIHSACAVLRRTVSDDGPQWSVFEN